MTPTTNGTASQVRPPWVMRHIFDPLTVWLVGTLGMDDRNGTRVLRVQGRASGRWHATPVRLLELDGRRYVVAMYGETNWARNLRARGCGQLQMGHQVIEFRAVPVTGPEQLQALRAYFKRYWPLVAQLTTITSPDAPDDELARVAPLHPVFRLD